jgi:N-acetylglucosamine malate deacetylase 1
MKILAFGAHPDDIEFGCGGILLKLKQEGHDLFSIVLSKGEAGSAGNGEIREQETKNAAAILGADLRFLDLGGDSHLEYNVPNKMAIARTIREIAPDIVLSPLTMENQHPDHCILGKMVRDSARLARYGGLQDIADLKPHKISSLYQFASTSMPGGNPTILVDISDVVDKWVEAICAHQSQVSARSYGDMLKSRAQLLGLTCGVKFAQGLWSDDPIAVTSISTISRTAR